MERKRLMTNAGALIRPKADQACGTEVVDTQAIPLNDVTAD
ncbi:hypothetical protein [Geobacter sulfurreducens]|nr:hypothetical protein [Geobacter sulfurreducens]BBA71231.1 hypothetical protein YM18_2715 [Geobacter sulfurreducens]